jgi:hypothetical protein
MIEVSTLSAVLAVETIVVLFGTIILLGYRLARKKRMERTELNEFIERVNQCEAIRRENLYAALTGHDRIVDEAVYRETVENVIIKERALYRQLFDAFLSRDMAKLAEIDLYTRELSEPYCYLVNQLPKGTLPQDHPEHLDYLEDREKIARLENEVIRLQDEATQTQTQLTQTLEALVDISTEYTKMFGSSHSTAELQASVARLLDVFRRTEHACRAVAAPVADSRELKPQQEAT